MLLLCVVVHLQAYGLLLSSVESVQYIPYLFALDAALIMALRIPRMMATNRVLLLFEASYMNLIMCALAGVFPHWFGPKGISWLYAGATGFFLMAGQHLDVSWTFDLMFEV